MPLRRVALALILVSTPAAADTFGGFSGVDRHYLVNQDRVCTPIRIAGGGAAGTPVCQQAGADVIARLSIKDPIAQRGARAVFAATAAGRTLTVTRKTGEPLLTWEALDPIVKVIEVYGSQYEDRVAVAYSVRRMGKELVDVIGFDLGQAQSAVRDPAGGDVRTTLDPSAKDPGAKDPSADPAKDPSAKPPEDPRLGKALAAARKAPRARALAAWKAALVIDPEHAEALYGLALAQAAGKAAADAMISLTALAGSSRPDAIEWLVEARFNPAFAAVRADPKFRAAVGLDRKPIGAYERLMGFGGQWEQTGTSCDRPEVRFVATRDRAFKLRVKTVCQGSSYDVPFKGTWRVDRDQIVLTVPTRGRQVSAADEAKCAFEQAGDEDALHCNLGKDIEFTVLPTRR